MIELSENALAMTLLRIEGLNGIPNCGLPLCSPPRVQGHRPGKNGSETEFLIHGILD